MPYRLALLLAFAASTAGAYAQPASPADAFAPLDLPTPNSFRTADGRPGPDYWQQRANYRIEVALDPATHRVEGTETIVYTNNSPQPLGYLWLQLDQNLFAMDSRGARLQPSSSRWSGAFEAGGFDVTRVEVVRGDERGDAATLVDDTRMRIDLERPLPPGGTLRLEVDFGFTVPEYGADRMSRLDVAQGTVYEIAQWYPRFSVYDDVNGWNPMPYLGQGEFYLEYGTFEVEITVPSDFIVVATGEFMNPDEVLTPAQQERLALAQSSAETVALVRPGEVGERRARPRGQETLTWRYRAEDVRDFAWAASQAFIWDATSWEGVLVMAAYPSEGLGTSSQPGWEEAAQYGRHAISHYSDRWYRYPYPVAISVGGRVGGMEYPMIQFSSVQARDQSLFGVIDHELGHNWFPMIVGSDERRHAWMDEGFNTFINYYSNRAFYGDAAQRTARVAPTRVAERMQEDIADQPSMTYPDRIRREGLGFLAYRKPAAGLILLREAVLGPERFDSAFRAYIKRWAYKHPQPADFFRTMNDVAGEDLSWFWRGWLYGTGEIDQAIASVVPMTAAESPNGLEVTVENRGELVMPVRLEVTYADGTSEVRRIPVEAWFTDDTFTVPLSAAQPITTLRLDPEGLLPDVDVGNNEWTAGE